MERWRSVPGYPTLEASDLGRVRVKPKNGPLPNGGFRVYQCDGQLGAIARSKKNAAHAYRHVSYRSLGTIKVHKLVCLAFHGEPPFPKAVVIHLDEDGLNNIPSNLKWGTMKENMNMPKLKAWQRTRTGNNNPFVKGKR